MQPQVKECVMSKKITISVPDLLFIRLENYRKKILISGICAKALEEAMDGHDDCVKAAKKRLSLLTDKEKHRLSYEEGRKWAGYEASLEQLAIVSLWEYNDEDASKLQYAFGKNRKRIHDKIRGYSNVLELVMNSFMSKEVLTDSDTEDFFYENHEAAMAFIDGAQEIWREIQNEAMKKILTMKEQ